MEKAKEDIATKLVKEGVVVLPSQNDHVVNKPEKPTAFPLAANFQAAKRAPNPLQSLLRRPSYRMTTQEKSETPPPAKSKSRHAPDQTSQKKRSVDDDMEMNSKRRRITKSKYFDEPVELEVSDFEEASLAVERGDASPPSSLLGTPAVMLV
ncbi:hypothetical protein H2200_009800 [Cladophialophora chaetospira]|uniref:Uncharacterized protein n=1 Tax=Cladophialophora chaetospira TaxID=386627 RepID=A0AA38X343_9EURO|nr:hypothetical protein H2200_009800 [Cladophialophora chaetospira]